MAQGLPSDPDLHHSLRRCQSTHPVPWRGAWHMCDIVTTQLCTAWLEPAGTAAAQCPQPQQVTCSKDTQVQRRSLCTKAQAHLGSQSQFAVLPCIAGALPLPVVLIIGHWQCQCKPQLHLSSTPGTWALLLPFQGVSRQAWRQSLLFVYRTTLFAF